jgi:hypothetical protein
LDHRSADRPGNTEARYEQLSGGPSERVLLYLARRYLRMSYQEWRDAPWWVQRTYIEGMMQEELLQQEGSETSAVDDDPVGADLSGYEEMGLTVIRGGEFDG